MDRWFRKVAFLYPQDLKVAFLNRGFIRWPS
jgi:hypothetical protein